MRIKIQVTLQRKTIKHFDEDPTYAPRSARFKLKLTAAVEVEERPEFTKAAEES